MAVKNTKFEQNFNNSAWGACTTEQGNRVCIYPAFKIPLHAFVILQIVIIFFYLIEVKFKELINE